MTVITYDGGEIFKKCPFRRDKKGKCLDCFGHCALYVGKFPFGECAMFVTAQSVLTGIFEREEPSENDENQNPTSNK